MENLQTIDEFKKYIRTKLGEPKIRVELADSQIEQSLYDSIQLYREYATAAGNFQACMVIDLLQGIRDYTLPENVMQVGSSKRQQDGSGWVLANLSGAAATDALHLKSFDLVSYTMLLGWLHTLRIVTRSPYAVRFNHNTKVLTVIPIPSKDEKLFIQVFVSATVDELLDERFIKEYTLALCKIQLGDIRNKFQSLPGFNNAVSLNGETLKTEGQDEKKTLEDDLILNYKWSKPPIPLFRSID